MPKFSYDEGCELLARDFLLDTVRGTDDTIEETEIQRLAQRIQDSIEEWMSDNGY